MIGVSRPNSYRIINNIKNNIKYFNLNYSKKYSFCFIVSTYRNSFSDKVEEYCIKNNIQFVIMDQIKDFKMSGFYSEKINKITEFNTNSHRIVLKLL